MFTITLSYDSMDKSDLLHLYTMLRSYGIESEADELEEYMRLRFEKRDYA